MASDDDSDIEFFADECVFLDDDDITLAHEVSMVDESVIVYDHEHLTKFVSRLVPPISWRDSEFAQAKRISNVVDIFIQRASTTTNNDDRYIGFAMPVVKLQRYVSNEKNEETVMRYDGDKWALESLKKYLKRVSDRHVKQSYPTPFVVHESMPEMGMDGDVIFAWSQATDGKIYEIHRVLKHDRVEMLGLCNLNPEATETRELDIQKYQEFVAALKSGDAVIVMYNHGPDDNTEPGIVVAANSDTLTIKTSRSKTDVHYSRKSLGRMLSHREFTLAAKDGTVHFNHRLFWTTRTLVLVPSRQYMNHVLPYNYEWHRANPTPHPEAAAFLSATDASRYIRSRQDYNYFMQVIRDNISKLPVALDLVDPPQIAPQFLHADDERSVSSILRQDIDHVNEGRMTNTAITPSDEVDNERNAIVTKVDAFLQDAMVESAGSLRQVYTTNGTEPVLFWHAATLRACNFIPYGGNLLVPSTKDTAEHASRIGLMYDDRFLMVWSAPLIQRAWRRLLRHSSVPRQSLATTPALSAMIHDDKGHTKEVATFVRPFQLAEVVDFSDVDLDEYNTVYDNEDGLHDYYGDQDAEDGEENYDMDDEPDAPATATEVLEYGADLSKLQIDMDVVDADTVLNDIQLADGSYTPDHMLWVLTNILKLRLNAEETARASAYLSLHTPVTEIQFVNKRKRLIAVLSKTFPADSDDHRVGLLKIDEAISEQRTKAYRQLLFDGCAYLIVLVQCSFPATRVAASIDLFGYPLTDRNAQLVEVISAGVLDNLSKIDEFSFLLGLTVLDVQDAVVASVSALMERSEAVRHDMSRARERLQTWEEQSKSYGVWETFRPFLERVDATRSEDDETSCLKKLLVRADEKIADKVTGTSCCAHSFNHVYWTFIDSDQPVCDAGDGKTYENAASIGSIRVVLSPQDGRRTNVNDIIHVVDQGQDAVINIHVPPVDEVVSTDDRPHEQTHMDELRACIQRLATIFPNKKALEFLAVIESTTFTRFECLRDCTAHMHRMMQRSLRTKMFGSSPLNAQQQTLFKSLASSITASEDVYDLVQLVISVVRIALESTQTSGIPVENEFEGISKADYTNIGNILNDMFAVFVRICSLQVLIADTDTLYENDRETYKQQLMTITKSLQYDARFAYRELKARGVDVITYLSALSLTTPSATDL